MIFDGTAIGYFRERIRYETANKEAKKVREVANWVWAESEPAEGGMVWLFHWTEG